MREFRRFDLSASDIEKLFTKAGYKVGQNFEVRVAPQPCDRMDNAIGYGKNATMLHVEWMDGDEDED